ncbi:MAG: glycosyltransferase, partial [Patescibacteria group bacterium]
MKIAQIVCTFPPYRGGIGNSAYNFAKIISSQGYEVTTFTPTAKQLREKDKKLNSIGKIVKLKPWLKYGNGAFMPQLFFRLKKYDLIFFHYPFFGTAEVIWFYKIFYPKKKLIIHYHMDVIQTNFLTKMLSLTNRLIRNSLFNKANIITCASLDYIKHSQIAKFYYKNPEKFKEIPFGVDTHKFSPLPVKKQGAIYPLCQGEKINMLPHLNKGGQGGVILFVGGLDQAHYFKGVNILLKAVAELKIKNWQLNIAGDGNLKTS